MQKEAQEKIKLLVDKYNGLTEVERNKYNEEETKNYFIRPMFEALGWDFANSNEVAMERGSVGKRADYEFKLNGITKFFVEAKSIKVDLDLEQHARQAIKYSWNRGVDWAVLTDFESIKVFYAQSESKNILDRLVFELSYSEYISDFETIWLLAKESFAGDLLEKFAIKHGKRLKKLTVNEKLFDDLKEARKLLTKTFGDWNKVDQEILEEGVQRILDRLVFIRVLEDRKLEEPILKTILNQWVEGGKKEQLFHIFADKFKELDEIYNSNIFHKHACDQWEEYDSKMWQKVINSLYGSDVYEYDFSQIPADILGGVYESYLGYIAQKPIEVDKSGKTGKLLKFEDKKELKLKSRKKRKEQGIYYTPKFIVNYIVKNTLGEKLKEIKTVGELKKLKVLDPACGSGSFLTRALEEMFEKYRDFNYRGGQQEVKTTILLENIYGVDLDQQAVELARLNLLIDSLDTKTKLPYLKNIRNGNSLISGTEEELKKYFNGNWRDKKPFNWQEEFSDVFKQGGFDVIIGNPPYVDVRKINTEDKVYLFGRFECTENRTNTFSIFFDLGLSLLKDGGCLGFIVPNTILTHSSYKKLRKKILDQCLILKIYDSGKDVFKGVNVETVVIVVKKEKDGSKRENNTVVIDKLLGDRTIKQFKMNQNFFSNDRTKRFLLHYDETTNRVLSKIRKNCIDLGLIYHGYNGINPGNKRSEVVVSEQKSPQYKKVVDGKHIRRYAIEWGGDWILYDKDILERARREEIFLEKPKIILQKIGTKLVASLDDTQLYSLINTTILLREEKDYEQKYILALINSKLLNFFYEKEFLGVQIKTEFLDKLPIYLANKKQQKAIVELVNKMLDLNKQIQSIVENSEKYNSLKSEIEKIDKLIDQKVYELYGLTEEEIKVVEN